MILKVNVGIVWDWICRRIDFDAMFEPNAEIDKVHSFHLVKTIGCHLVTWINTCGCY